MKSRTSSTSTPIVTESSTSVNPPSPSRLRIIATAGQGLRRAGARQSDVFTVVCAVLSASGSDTERNPLWTSAFAKAPADGSDATGLGSWSAIGSVSIERGKHFCRAAWCSCRRINCSRPCNPEISINSRQRRQHWCRVLLRKSYVYLVPSLQSGIPRKSWAETGRARKVVRTSAFAVEI